MRNKIILLAGLIVLGIGLNAEDNNKRYVSISYFMKIHFGNFDKFSAIQDPNLPKLSNNTRFHGMKIEIGLTENIIIGLYTTGSLNDNRNDNGYTSWGGALGVPYVQYKYFINESFFGSFGIGLGCGRFTYSTSYRNGDKSITSHNDKIFLEPMANIGYIVPVIPWQFIISPEVSYITNLEIPGLSNGYYAGENNDINAFPKGWILGSSIGYKF
ncbi:hypothetical protein LQZ19_09230 [Treponema primitia]|uniref:hypothetical protein n=1 Tax=Treponema primitia TaxID=88058 RepID=UPI003980767B